MFFLVDGCLFVGLCCVCFVVRGCGCYLLIVCGCVRLLLLVVRLRWRSLSGVSCLMVVLGWLLLVVVVCCLSCVGVRCMFFLVVVCV